MCPKYSLQIIHCKERINIFFSKVSMILTYIQYVGTLQTRGLFQAYNIYAYTYPIVTKLVTVPDTCLLYGVDQILCSV